MSDTVSVDTYTVVFNCISCGALLSCDNTFNMAATCLNCGAFYEQHGNGTIYRYRAGRPPTQWTSNGYTPTEEKQL